MSEGYNGWPSRETWLVMAWFNPETLEGVEWAKEAIEEAYDSTPDFLRDFISIEKIDWDEIRSHFDEEEDEEEEEEEEED